MPIVAQTGKVELSGFPEDWTHHHVVFSNPGAADTSFGKHQYDRWLKVMNSPRYRRQQARRSRDHAGLGGSRRTKQQPIKTDWSTNLGNGATVGASQYPAKYSFSTTSESCTPRAAPTSSGSAASVRANGNTTANGITCTGACLYNYDVTNSSATTGVQTLVGRSFLLSLFSQPEKLGWDFNRWFAG